MLARALKPNFEVLRDAVKQLLIWSRNKRAEFSTSFEDNDSFPFERNKYSQRSNNFRFNEIDDDDYNYDGRRNTSYSRGSRHTFGKYRNNNAFYSRQRFADDSILRHEDVIFGENLKPKVTDFYKPHPDVLNRSIEEINEFRKKNDIQVFGNSKDNCVPPILSFDELDLSGSASEVIRNLNYSNPTPVQSQTWPIVLSGHNMVGISRTGSGKTLGFILPGIIHIKHQPPLERGEGPIALVVAPTRELVQQILRVTQPFARKLNLRTAALYGGAKKDAQINQLLHGAEICVATPGRLNDVLSNDYVKLDRCTYMVLDEADRLLDMGFHPQIKSIFHNCRPDRQVSMWSATWPKEVRYLAEDFLKNYIAVKFGSSELTANPNIKQHVHVCEEREKFGLLKDLLDKINETDDNKTLIFANTKMRVKHIEFMLHRHGYRCTTIHGDKNQNQRDYSLREFRSGFRKIMVGTAVVGRGIDIGDIRYVINYDFPNEIENYVHIIGRTARNESPGTSHTFFTYKDSPKAKDLIKILNQTNQEINPILQGMVVENRFPGRPKLQQQRRYSNDWDEF